MTAVELNNISLGLGVNQSTGSGGHKTWEIKLTEEQAGTIFSREGTGVNIKNIDGLSKNISKFKIGDNIILTYPYSSLGVDISCCAIIGICISILTLYYILTNPFASVGFGSESYMLNISPQEDGEIYLTLEDF